MQTILNTPDDPAHDSLVEKKSEFIGDAAHVDTLDEALAFVAAIREQHPKARHVAYAAVCGGADGRLSERMSDDGEPSGTAGKPILDVLKQSGTTDCVVAVTRYFGGILLGSGGLVRAYSSAASLAMKAARAARIEEGVATAETLLSHLSLLFVPAGVGIIQHGARLAEEWLALTLALVLSTLITVAVTALAMRALIHRRDGEQRSG